MLRTCLNGFVGLFLAVTMAVIAPHQAPASNERTISWEDLTPPAEDLRKPFEHLSETQMSDLYELYKLHGWLRTDGGKKDTSLGQQIDEMTKTLADQQLDVADLLAKLTASLAAYDKLKSTPVAALDGELIRMPGYVLPLEFGGDAVSEFFLVPYVGACIHTPPPAANQIVLVRLNQTYKMNGLYDAVWVTGRLKIVENEMKLGYRDGVGKVSSTYEIEGMKIVPYKR
jgi:hypothetical protein